MAPECYSRHSNAMRRTRTSRANVPSPCLTPLHPGRDNHQIATGAARGGYRRPPRRDRHRIAVGAGRRRPPSHPRPPQPRPAPDRGRPRRRRPPSHLPLFPPRPPPDRRQPRRRHPPSHSPPPPPRLPPDRHRRGPPTPTESPAASPAATTTGSPRAPPTESRAATPAVTNPRSPPAQPSESPDTAPVPSALPRHVQGQKRGRPVLSLPFPRRDRGGDPARSLKTFGMMPISSSPPS